MNIKRKILLGVIVIALLCIGQGVQAATMTVSNGQSIQAAIDAASLGDTIEVGSGTYYENIVVEKQIILNGVDTGSGKPVIDAMGGAGTGIGMGLVANKLIETFGGAGKTIAGALVNLGKFGVKAGPLIAAIVGAIGGGSLYYMTRPGETSPDEVKHLEQLALLKRLSGRAKRRKKDKAEPDTTASRSDDAHKKLTPSTGGVEV